MRRFPSLYRSVAARRARAALCLSVVLLGACWVGASASGCTTTAAESRLGGDADAAGTHRDSGYVDPPDGGTADAAAPPEGPECSAYCDTVQASCTEGSAQYTSRDECLAFCGLLPAGMTGESAGDSVACRAFYAGSPARTDATYCAAAGPYGGGVCGDRCPIFCALAMSACGAGSDGGPPPYASYPDCQTACVGFGYRDGGVDGGGEGALGPDAGDTLNCRLFYLRQAVTSGTSCENIAVDSPACR
ncbi:MAG: hypothetical protein JWP97_556 [Labilithrix sp.]|nr:hypothetical protein [Labilithrix sp.]